MAERVQALRRENQQLREELEREKRELTKKIEALQEQLAALMRRFFGRSSEQFSADEKVQMRLFDEREPGAGGAMAPEGPAIQVPAHTRRRPKRQPLPECLPREEVLIDIPEEDKSCGCGEPMVRIGEERSEKLDVVPPRVRVIRTIRPKYACRRCEGSGDEERPAVRVAPMPPAIIDKSIATAGTLAYIVTGKFCDALPLYRQEKQFARIGVELSRRTMADWMIQLARACEPMMELMRERLRSGPVLQMDETTVQVLEEEGRKNTSTSYMWVARGGPPGSPVVLYHYSPSRSVAVAEELLGDYEGYVQTDGYEVYDRACAREGIEHVGCWAHARRLYVDVKKSSSKAGSADEAMGLIARLYAVEADRESFDEGVQFAAHRRARVEPVLQKLRGWLERRNEQVPPSSGLGKAIGYTLTQWPKLIRYLDHPALTPDTNPCERAIRPFVVGRKNWLFSGSPRGAHASATLYSIIETAKANGREPYWYLRTLFDGLPTAGTPEQLARLAPFSSA